MKRQFTNPSCQRVKFVFSPVQDVKQFLSVCTGVQLYMIGDLSSQPFSELVDHLFRSLIRPITMRLPPATRQSKSKTRMQLYGFEFQIVFRDHH